MNKLKLVLTEETVKDINSISESVAKNNVILAKSVIDELFNTLYTLSEFPDIGKTKSDINNEPIRFFIHKKKYIFAYEITKDSVVILRVLADYQDILALLN